MNIGVPSRFACLKIEGDENINRATSINRKKSTINQNNNDNKTTMAKKPNTNNNNNNKKTNPHPTNNNNNNKQTNPKKQKKKQGDKQWEDWKKKDSEMVNDNYEQDLQYAIIQSKLEYDKNVITITTTTENDKQANNNKTKKKNKPMNLAEFLETDTDNNPSNDPSTDDAMINNQHLEDNDDFFDKMVEVAKREVIKGKIEEQRKERDINFEEMITKTQYQEKLQLVQQRNAELKKQLDEARAEITAVKERNKIFCTILAQGEMKDKAGILLELERLNNVKDELTEEVARLHKLLEQERSKSASLQDSQNHTTKHKDNKKQKKGR